MLQKDSSKQTNIRENDSTLKTLMIVTISCLTLAHKVSVTHALDIHE